MASANAAALVSWTAQQVKRFHYAVVFGFGQNNDRPMSLARNVQFGVTVSNLIHIMGKVLTKIGIGYLSHGLCPSLCVQVFVRRCFRQALLRWFPVRGGVGFGLADRVQGGR
jgi:hypothetical protein